MHAERPLLALLHLAARLAWLPLLGQGVRVARRNGSPGPPAAWRGSAPARRRHRRSVASPRRLCGDGPAGRSPGAASSPGSARRARRSRRSPAPASASPPCSCRPSPATRPAAAPCWSAAPYSCPCCSCRATASVRTGRRSRTSCWPAPSRDDLVIGKARSIGIVASPLALIGPLLAASITGEWRYLVAGLGVGVGALLAGTGAAVVQSALVPIAMPESDNPFASGESGKGMLAGAAAVRRARRPGAGDDPRGAGADLGDRPRQHAAGHRVRARSRSPPDGWSPWVGVQDRQRRGCGGASRSSWSSVTPCALSAELRYDAWPW